MPPQQRRATEAPVSEADLAAAFGPEEGRPVEVPAHVEHDSEEYRQQLLDRMRRGAVVQLPTGGPTVTPLPNVYTQLAKFQANLPKIAADETARVPGKEGKQGYSYQYAGLDLVADRVLKALGAVGLSWVTTPTMTPNGMVLRYELVHGESMTKIEGVWPLATDTRNPQAAGSAITYARRYCLLSVSGCFPGGEDDDGAQAKAGYERERMNANNDAWRGHQPRNQAREEQRGLERSVQRAQQASQQRPPARQEPEPVADITTAGYPGADEAGDEEGVGQEVDLGGLAVSMAGNPEDPTALIVLTGGWYGQLTDEQRDTEISPADNDDPRTHGRTIRKLYFERVRAAVEHAKLMDSLTNVLVSTQRAGVYPEHADVILAKKAKLEGTPK